MSVKPHASPVLHAINYLLGELDESYLTTLRAFGGLQSYPSRVKDPDPVDYSTGSVGIGATAPIWGALARRYVNGRFTAATAPERRPPVLAARRRRARRGRGLGGDRRPGRGRARRGRLGRRPEPAVAGPGRAQHRGRPAAGHVRRGRLAGDHGQVRPAARGAVRPAGRRRRCGERIDEMPNPEYQRLLRCDAGRAARDRLPGDGPSARSPALVGDSTTTTLLRGDPQPRRPRPAARSTRRSARSTTPGRR